MLNFKLGDTVKILDISADCPTSEGVIISIPFNGVEEYTVLYHDGVDYVSGEFFEYELEKREIE